MNSRGAGRENDVEVFLSREVFGNLYLEFIFSKNAVLCIPNTRGQWKCTRCRLRNVQCKKKGMSGHASSQWMSTGQATKEAYMHRRIDASFYECLSYFQ